MVSDLFTPLSPQEPPAVVWPVGALCRAVGEVLAGSFRAVSVVGELSGFSRAASGHCYFSLKDAQGQLRCAMFRRAAQDLSFIPRDGEQVQVLGHVSVYEPRGDLQLIVERMAPAGLGVLYERFLRLKAQLEAEGLFDAARKREIPLMPRGIGVVTSLQAAALHDVATALRRRVPHIPVWLAPASVQGAGAAEELVQALEQLYEASASHPLDVILLVRGGGSIEDLWAFNDERLARTMARSPVPIISGVGHENDFSIADFVADLRAPTPTAAAELSAQARDDLLQVLQHMGRHLQDEIHQQLDFQAQRLDRAAARLGRPSQALHREHRQLQTLQQRLRLACMQSVQQQRGRQDLLVHKVQQKMQNALKHSRYQLDAAAMKLQLLDPTLVLQRGYAWVSDEKGKAVLKAEGLKHLQKLQVHLAQGEVVVKVHKPAPAKRSDAS